MVISMKKTIIGLLVLVGIGLAVVYYKYPLELGRFFESYISDNVSHRVPCEQLPSVEEVDMVVAEHKDTVNQIITETGSHIIFDWGPDRENCGSDTDRGSIVIYYPAHGDRVIIEQILGQTFFGIPYSLRNI